MNPQDITGMALAIGLSPVISSHPAVRQLVKEAVLNEREACAKRAEIALLGTLKTTSDRVLKAIRNTSQL